MSFKDYSDYIQKRKFAEGATIRANLFSDRATRKNTKANNVEASQEHMAAIEHHERAKTVAPSDTTKLDHDRSIDYHKSQIKFHDDRTK